MSKAITVPNNSSEKFISPQSEIYFCNVPFGLDQKNVIMFSNKTEQQNYFLKFPAQGGCATQHYTGLNIIRKEKQLAIRGNFGLLYDFNYIAFRNPANDVERGGEQTERWWYCFVTDVHYCEELVTKIEFEVDSWQTFQFDIVYYDSWITRAHCRKANDTLGGNLESEPLAYDKSYQVLTEHIDGFSWSIDWFLKTLSKPVPDGSSWDFQVGGTGLGVYKTPYYYYRTLSMPSADVNAYIDSRWNNVSTWSLPPISSSLGDIPMGFVDRRKDVVELIGRPAFLTSDIPMANALPVPSVSIVTKHLTPNVTRQSLACGYSPRNKKMFTSLFNSISLFNRSGFYMPFKPELLRNDSIDMTVEARQLDGDIMISINNYNDINGCYAKIPYNLSMPVAFDENASIGAQLDRLRHAFSIAYEVGSTVVAGGLGVAGLEARGAYAASKGARGGAITNPDYFRVAKGQLGLETANSGVTTIGKTYDHLRNIAELGADKPIMQGSDTGDLVSYLDIYKRINIAQSSPTYTECQRIDRFFDMYGYAQNFIGYPYAWATTRSRWNYLQTSCINLKVKAPAIYEEEIKAIFDSGVTLWHGADGFGDYSNPNTNV